MFPGGSPYQDHEKYCSAENMAFCTGELDVKSHTCVCFRPTASNCKTDDKTKATLAASMHVEFGSRLLKK